MKLYELIALLRALPSDQVFPKGIGVLKSQRNKHEFSVRKDVKVSSMLKRVETAEGLLGINMSDTIECEGVLENLKAAAGDIEILEHPFIVRAEMSGSYSVEDDVDWLEPDGFYIKTTAGKTLTYLGEAELLDSVTRNPNKEAIRHLIPEDLMSHLDLLEDTDTVTVYNMHNVSGTVDVEIMAPTKEEAFKKLQESPFTIEGDWNRAVNVDILFKEVILMKNDETVGSFDLSFKEKYGDYPKLPNELKERLDIAVISGDMNVPLDHYSNRVRYSARHYLGSINRESWRGLEKASADELEALFKECPWMEELL